MRQVVQPTERPSEGPHIGGTIYEHPAFGQISAHRISGQSVLYGTDVVHHQCVEIEIKHSRLERDLARDWHYARGVIAQVRLSEAQWATLVSSLNQGQGVPCTVTFTEKDSQIPAIPLRNTADVYKQEADEAVAGVADQIRAAIADIEGELGESVSAKKRAAILARMRSALTQVTSNLPFVAKSFQQHMDTFTEHAKVEVEAYMHTAVQRAGLAALRGETQMPLQLPGARDGAAS